MVGTPDGLVVKEEGPILGISDKDDEGAMLG